jgi:hypothetical protein
VEADSYEIKSYSLLVIANCLGNKSVDLVFRSQDISGNLFSEEFYCFLLGLEACMTQKMYSLNSVSDNK